jgi:hypothetical protein
MRVDMTVGLAPIPDSGGADGPVFLHGCGADPEAFGLDWFAPG